MYPQECTSPGGIIRGFSAQPSGTASSGTASSGTVQRGTRKVWLDCDPGHDDALAIVLAAHNPSLELVGISAVSGNRSLEKTFANSRLMVAVGMEERFPYFLAWGSLFFAISGMTQGFMETGLDGSKDLENFRSRLGRWGWRGGFESCSASAGRRDFALGEISARI